LLDAAQAATLSAAHAALLAAALGCTLDARPRVLPRRPALDAHCAGVVAVAQASGFGVERA
jgi:glutamate-ammonia-ligase adenylyltransferase